MCGRVLVTEEWIRWGMAGAGGKRLTAKCHGEPLCYRQSVCLTLSCQQDTTCLIFVCVLVKRYGLSRVGSITPPSGSVVILQHCLAPATQLTGWLRSPSHGRRPRCITLLYYMEEESADSSPLCWRVVHSLLSQRPSFLHCGPSRWHGWGHWGHGDGQVLFQDFIDAFEFYCENMTVHVARKSVSATIPTARDNKLVITIIIIQYTVKSGHITASLKKYFWNTVVTDVVYVLFLSF